MDNLIKIATQYGVALINKKRIQAIELNSDKSYLVIRMNTPDLEYAYEGKENVKAGVKALKN